MENQPSDAVVTPIVDQSVPEVTSNPTTPPPEDSARCMIAHVDNLNELAAASDYGWMGISEETAALLSSSSTEEGPKKNVVVIVSIPSRRAVVAYGVYLGALTKRSEIKETQRRDLPAHWGTVARVGWVRVGEASWEAVSNSNASTGGLLEVFTGAAAKYAAGVRAEDTTAHPSTWCEIPKGGDIVCASIDSSSLQVLPHDLRDLHLNPQAAADLAERNNASQAQRQQENRNRQGGGFGHGTPGYQARHQNSYGSQPYNNRQQNSYGAQQQAYYGAQQQQQQQQQGYYQQQPQQQAYAGADAQQPTDPAQAAALAQYYQYMATLTPEQQQIAYQHYVAQYYQQQGGAPAEGAAPPS